MVSDHSYRVLVTGASGFIGSRLCTRLRDEGHGVRAATRRGPSQPREGVDYCLVGDLAGAVDWRACLRDVDVVVHCAAAVHRAGGGGRRRERYWTVNAQATRRLAEQAAGAGVRRLIAISSIAALTAGAPNAGLYEKSKRRAEELLQAVAADSGLEVVVLRPPLVYGPNAPANFARLVRAIAAGVPLPLAGIDNRRSFLYLENLIDLIGLCLHHPQAPGHIFSVGDGVDLSTPDFARLIGEALGRPARLWACPPWALRLGGALTGQSRSVHSLMESLWIDNRPLAASLGWQPRFDTRAGLEATLAAGGRRTA